MITGTVKGQSLRISSPTIAADTISYLTARFVFTSDWDGAVKFAHFSCGENNYSVPLTDDEIREGDKLNLGAGTWKVWLHGERYEGGELKQRITTEEALLVVRATGSFEGGPFPTAPSEIERLHAEFDKVKRGVQSDWGQNDETAADFVRNRPGGYVVEQEQSITLKALDQMFIDGIIEAKPNDIITLNIDGVSNSYEVKSFGESGILYIGDSPEEEPTMGFMITFNFDSIGIFNNDEAEHTYKFKCKVPKKFPKEYLPNEVFEIEFNNWYSSQNRLDDEEMSRLKKLRLYARKQSGGYNSNIIAVSPDGSLYLTKTFIAKTTLPAIEFNSNLNSQDISVAKNDLKVGDFVVLQISDTATKHNTYIVFPPIDAGLDPSYPSNDMQTVAYINNKLFAITVTGVYVSGSMKNTTINIKRIL